MKYLKIVVIPGLVGFIVSWALIVIAPFVDDPVQFTIGLLIFAPIQMYLAVQGVFSGEYSGPNPPLFVSIALEWAWFIILGRIPLLMRNSPLYYKKLIAWLDRPK
jgi:hypothetical protein